MRFAILTCDCLLVWRITIILENLMLAQLWDRLIETPCLMPRNSAEGNLHDWIGIADSAKHPQNKNKKPPRISKFKRGKACLFSCEIYSFLTIETFMICEIIMLQWDFKAKKNSTAEVPVTCMLQCVILNSDEPLTRYKSYHHAYVCTAWMSNESETDRHTFPLRLFCVSISEQNGRI